ncbi:MAG TPA: lysophospholipid acyltransferase family protein [Alphaproteobacteria bacterium]|nr:lysophospholipid acyltransferase family protein [Alphaproteobacteria bacterium]
MIRALLFNVAFYGVTTILGILYLPLLLIPGKAGQRAMMAAGRAWSALILWLLKVIIGLDFEVRGREHLPAGPCLIAAKHQSAWDTLMLPVLLGDPVVVLKRELFWIPFYGWYAKRAGMVAIDRKGGAKALRAMLRDAKARTVKDGRALVIFPQGTRTAPGVSAPYQPGVAALYGDLGLPCVPMALNSGLFWGRRAFTKRPGRIIVEFLPAIPPGLAKRDLLARLEAAIEPATARLEKSRH